MAPCRAAAPLQSSALSRLADLLFSLLEFCTTPGPAERVQQPALAAVQQATHTIIQYARNAMPSMTWICAHHHKQLT